MRSKALWLQATETLGSFVTQQNLASPNEYIYKGNILSRKRSSDAILWILVVCVCVIACLSGCTVGRGRGRASLIYPGQCSSQSFKPAKPAEACFPFFPSPPSLPNCFVILQKPFRSLLNSMIAKEKLLQELLIGSQK